MAENAEEVVPIPEEIKDAEMLVQHLPIKALVIFNEHLFAAEGGHVFTRHILRTNVYEADTPLGQFRLFPVNLSINGLTITQEDASWKPNKNRIFLFAYAKNFGRVFHVEYNDNYPSGLTITPLSNMVDMEDWCQTAKWVGDSLICVTGHNSVIHYQQSRVGFLKLKEVQCTKTSIYSAHVSGEAVGELLIFVGTVFKIIQIWTITANVAVVLYDLTGHEGVILSIKFDTALGTILSTADDRSVRLWTIENVQECEKKTDSIPCQILAKTVKFENSVTSYGHTGRVFNAVFASNGTIISVGEESKIIHWDSYGNQIREWAGHKDKASLLTCCFDSINHLLFIGSNSGDLTMWPLAKTPTRLIESPACCAELGSADYPRTVMFYNSNILLAGMDSGKVVALYLNEARADPVVLLEDPSFTHYMVMGLSPYKTSSLAVGGANGLLVTYGLSVRDGLLYASEEEENGRDYVNTKIRAIFWLSPIRFVIQLQDGFQVVDLCLEAVRICNTSDVSFPEELSAGTEMNQRVFVLGDRNGSVHVFVWMNSEWTRTQSFLGVHSENGVTHLTLYKDWVMSSGKDSHVVTFEQSAGPRTKRSAFDKQLYHDEYVEYDFLTQSSTKILPFEWIGGMYPAERDKDLLICGFKSTKACFYSMMQSRVVATLECGGGHRSWDFFIDENKMGVFGCIKRKTIQCTSIDVTAGYGVPLKTGTHALAINCVIEMFRFDGKIYFATGGEDSKVRISSVERTRFGVKPIELECELEQGHHTSSVRSVFFHKTNDKIPSGLLLTCGGRSTINWWGIQLTTNLLGSEVVARHFATFTGDGADYRVMDIRAFIDPKFVPLSPLTGEHNYLNFVIFTACSDGAIRSYLPIVKGESEGRVSYSMEPHRIYSYRKSPNPSYAITKCRVNGFKSGLNRLLCLMGTTVSGRVCVWWIHCNLRSISHGFSPSSFTAAANQQMYLATTFGSRFPSIIPHLDETVPLIKFHSFRIRRSPLTSLELRKYNETNNTLGVLIGMDDGTVFNANLFIRFPTFWDVFYRDKSKPSVLRLDTANFSCCHVGSVYGLSSKDQSMGSIASDQTLTIYIKGKVVDKRFSGVDDCQHVSMLCSKSKKDFVVICVGKGLVIQPGLERRRR